MNAPADKDLGIVVVEDNDTLRDLLVNYLEQPGRRVYGVDCGEALNTVLSTQPLDLAVLDVGLPYEDGLSIAQRLRRSHPHIKIVMLTARVRPVDRTEGYDAGADVYLTKPTNVTELEAVIRNLFRVRSVYIPDGFALNRASLVLSSPQRKLVILTKTECRLIEQLALAPAEGLHTETLLLALQEKGKDPLSRENLAIVISRLRQKVLVELETTEFVETIRNYGYRLKVPVSLE